MKLKVDYAAKLLLALAMFAFGNFAYAQRTITGKVTDAATGEELIGANVLVIGTSSGTITDFDGNYSLNVPAGATELDFSYTGYASQRVEIGSQSVINVSLAVGSILDEVVVVGYGTVKKSDLTGSVGSVKEEDFNKGVFVAPDQLIQGKVAGVQILNNSGQPGAESTIRIRGGASVRAGNQPLFVVDGIPLDGRTPRPGQGSGTDLGATPGSNPLNFLNPNDIASIDVLKDASATAIYGSRGANGVVIITTKRGKSGDPRIDFNTSVGASNILKKYDVLDGNQYRQALDAYGLDRQVSDFGGNVDAMDEVLQTGIIQNHNISISGGSDKGNYRVSAGYLNQNGIVRESGLKKYTGSITGTYSFFNSKRLSVDFNLLASQVDEEIAPISTDAGFTGSLIGQALQWNPTRPLRRPDGSIDIDLGGTTINPLGMLAAYDDRSNLTNILGSISPSYKITNDLEYRFLYSINHGVGQRRAQIKSFINVQNIEGRGWGSISSATLSTQQFTHTLNYNKALSSAISLNALVGYEYQKFDNKGFGIAAFDFVSDDIDFTNVMQNSTPQNRLISSFADPIAELQSYFGRANFNIRNKYLFTATVRADGSSKFGSNNRYGIFPSFAAAWNLSSENFMSGSFFDQLKLRAGWGQTGNQEFPAGAAQERYTLGNNRTLFLSNVANPNLQWETSTTVNTALDFALFDYKVAGSIEYFHRTDESLLFNFQAIDPAPAVRYWVNLPGQVVNSGMELDLNVFIIENQKMSWSVGGNAAFLKNELRDYKGAPVLTGTLFGQGVSNATSQRLDNGRPLNSFYLRDWIGLNDQGVSEFVEDENALFHVGDPNPNVLLGLYTTLSVDKLSFVLNFNGALGYDLYNNTANTVLPIGNLGSRNIDANLIGGPIRESLGNSNVPSSRYLEPGDYLKLANATISYDFGNIGGSVKNVRLFVTGQNLLIFTNFSGFDPEVNTVNVRDGVPSAGIEYTPFPSARTFLFGANFSF